MPKLIALCKDLYGEEFRSFPHESHLYRLLEQLLSDPDMHVVRGNWNIDPDLYVELSRVLDRIHSGPPADTPIPASPVSAPSAASEAASAASPLCTVAQSALASQDASSSENNTSPLYDLSAANVSPGSTLSAASVERVALPTLGFVSQVLPQPMKLPSKHLKMSMIESQ